MTQPERRRHKHPTLEALCRQYGGISQIPLLEAYFRLSTSAWDVFIARIQPIIANRISDKTPVAPTMHIPGGCYETAHERTVKIERVQWEQPLTLAEIEFLERGQSYDFSTCDKKPLDKSSPPVL